MTELDGWIRRTAEFQPPPQIMAVLDQRMAHFDEIAIRCGVTVDPTVAVFVLFAVIHLAVATSGPIQTGQPVTAFQDMVGSLAYGFARRHLETTP